MWCKLKRPGSDGIHEHSTVPTLDLVLAARHRGTALRVWQAEQGFFGGEAVELDAVHRQGSKTGMARRMNSSNRGTVKAMSPCDGLYTMPFLSKLARAGPSVVILTPILSATSAVR
jgi:hypothetical protein